jgi:hypothetical protein
MFNVGDHVWTAITGLRPIEEPCPVCFGKKSVTVILGNEDEVVVPCSFCGHGYEPPSGVVSEYRIEPGTDFHIITGRDIHEGETTKITYCLDGGYREEQDNIFSTKEEALAASAKMCENEKTERETKSCYLKKDATKSFAWNAGYHLREAKRLREQIAYHERMAVLCKAKDKIHD